MKMIWLNFQDVIPNTLQEIEFSLNESLFSTFICYKQIQVMYWRLKPIEIQSVGH